MSKFSPQKTGAIIYVQEPILTSKHGEKDSITKLKKHINVDSLDDFKVASNKVL